MKSFTFIFVTVAIIGCGFLSRFGDAAAIQRRLGKLNTIPVSHNVKNGLVAPRKIDRDTIDGQNDYYYDSDYLDNDRDLESEKENTNYNYEEYPNTDSSEEKADSSEEDDGEYIYEDSYDDYDENDDEYEYDETDTKHVSDNGDPMYSSNEGTIDDEEEIYGSNDANEADEDEYNQDIYDTDDDYEEDDDEYEESDGNEVGHQVPKESNRQIILEPSLKHTSKGLKENMIENEERIMFSDDV